MNFAHPLGAAVQHWRFANGFYVTLFELGFEGRGHFGDVGARWEDVVALRQFHIVRRGYTAARNVGRLEVRTSSGAVFAIGANTMQAFGTTLAVGLGTSDTAVADAADAFMRATTPHLLRAAEAQLANGGAVPFSNTLRVGPHGIEMNLRGSWQLLPTHAIAGYRLTQGHCLIDENPGYPTLKFSIPIAEIDNAHVFLPLLASLAPGKDLDAFPYRVRTAPKTAATHDPREVSFGQRMKIIGIAAGIFAVPMSLLIGAAYLRDHHHATDVTPSGPSIDSLRETQEKAIASAPTPTRTLGEACRAANVNLLNTNVAFLASGEEKAPPGLFPAYVYTDLSGWGFHASTRAELGDHFSNFVIARAVEGTDIAHPGTSKVHLVARVFDSTMTYMLCEGTVDAGWKLANETPYSPTACYDETAGLMKSVLRELCQGRDAMVCSRSEDVDVARLLPVPTAAPSAAASAKPRPGYPQRTAAAGAR